RHVVSRRKLLGAGLAGTAVGLAAVVDAPASLVAARVDGPSRPVGDVYQLQAAFHRANSQGDPNSPYAGSDSLRGFWLNSGSFKNHRLSLVLVQNPDHHPK